MKVTSTTAEDLHMFLKQFLTEIRVDMKKCIYLRTDCASKFKDTVGGKTNYYSCHYRIMHQILFFKCVYVICYTLYACMLLKSSCPF